MSDVDRDPQARYRGATPVARAGRHESRSSRLVARSANKLGQQPTGHSKQNLRFQAWSELGVRHVAELGNPGQQKANSVSELQNSQGVLT